MKVYLIQASGESTLYIFLGVVGFIVWAIFFVKIYQYNSTISRCSLQNNKDLPCNFVEVVVKSEHRGDKNGIYILEPLKKTFADLLAHIENGNYYISECSVAQRIFLTTGQAVYFIKHGNNKETTILLGRMSERARFALGLKVDINTAPFDVLTSIPYVSNEVARQIITTREQSSFTSIDELTKIRGIGDRTLERIRPYVECLSRPLPPEVVCTIPSLSESF